MRSVTPAFENHFKIRNIPRIRPYTSYETGLELILKVVRRIFWPNAAQPWGKVSENPTESQLYFLAGIVEPISKRDAVDKPLNTPATSLVWCRFLLTWRCLLQEHLRHCATCMKSLSCESCMPTSTSGRKAFVAGPHDDES